MKNTEKFNISNKKNLNNDINNAIINNIKIGKLKVKNIFAAPMAGVSDAAFRTLCLRKGFGLAFSEMISANALSRNNQATLKLLKRTKEEKIYPIQLFGQNTKNILKSIEILQDSYKVDLIDINFGCPAKKIIKQGAGSALLKRPNKIYEIIKESKNISSVPITAKIRTGITKKSINATEISKIIEKAEADLITIHGRTQQQGYNGTANWDIIKKVKEEINIPVIGNGDLTRYDDLTSMKINTNVDGFMIGRAIKNNPNILNENKNKDKNKNKNNNKNNILKEYLEIIDKYKLNIKFSIIKNHAMSFSKGLNLGPKIREKIMHSKDIEEIKKILE